ncbi:hypothetical protein CBL_01704 [Carabus blaptoides fortunei]
MEKTSKQADGEWRPSETKFLLDRYEGYLAQEGPMKKFKTKKVMWKKISSDMKNNVEYGEELKKICAIDDSLEPEVLRGVGQVSYKEPNIECCVLQDSNSEVEGSPIPRNKQKTVADTLKELHQIKEENKERRHQEKIGVTKELLKLLKKE